MVSDQNDETIMVRVKEGNLQYMSILFERYNVRLFNFFLRLTSDRDISNDLTQNLFVRVIRYRNTFKEDYSFKSWIYQMARNIHNDYRNELKRTGDIFTGSGIYPSDIPDEENVNREEDFVRLEKALSLLDYNQKELLILSKFQGLKYEEISSVTNQSVGAVKVAVHRAIKQLRSIYFKHV
ncbi:MAG TPA: RNA polymerase sigma factor [Bacteroidales bacterium]|nr:RNA polymerase sigma factor [Bacteroidales bacterium]